MKRLGIAIACAGREDLLSQCLASLNGFEGPVVIVYDGCAPARTPRDTLIVEAVGAPGRRAGISKAWNAGIKRLLAEGCDLVCIQNDDTWLPPSWVDDYRAVFDDDARVRCACAVDRGTASLVFPDLVPWDCETGWSTLAGVVPIVDAFYGPGGFGVFLARWRRDLDAAGVPRFLPARTNGASFVLDRQCIDEVGLFDEEFAPPGTGEDYDYWLRILRRFGPEAIGTATAVFIHHYRGATLGGLPRQSTEAAAAVNDVRLRAKLALDGLAPIYYWLAGHGSKPGAQSLPWREALPPMPEVSP